MPAGQPQVQSGSVKVNLNLAYVSDVAHWRPPHVTAKMHYDRKLVLVKLWLCSNNTLSEMNRQYKGHCLHVHGKAPLLLP